MTGTRNRSAWIWVAIAAIALASMARAQSGLDLARVYANPVVVFLAGERTAQPGVAAHLSNQGTPRARSLQDTGSALWLELLPVMFVGLLSPFGLLSPQSFFSMPRANAAPLLPALFQRPPPAHLL